MSCCSGQRGSGCCLVTKSHPTLCDPTDYIAPQVPLSVGFPRQEYWSGPPFPSQEDLPNPGIKSVSPELAGGFFTTEPPGKPSVRVRVVIKQCPESIRASPCPPQWRLCGRFPGNSGTKSRLRTAGWSQIGSEKSVWGNMGGRWKFSGWEWVRIKRMTSSRSLLRSHKTYPPVSESKQRDKQSHSQWPLFSSGQKPEK